MSEWQPIDTAPKDGTHVLLWNAIHQFVGQWVRDDVPSGGFWMCIYAHGQFHPTHWMPLPEPPTPIEDKTDG